MTTIQVIKECKRRWGPTGNAQVNRKAKLSKSVGQVVLGTFFEVKGQGETWEDAFADADRKNIKAEARHA